MKIWASEIKELEKLYGSLKNQFPEIGKELEKLINTDDPNVVLLYSRRCLEIIIADLCELELKRPRGTEPLKGIIDKLFKEKIVPSHIITSMHGLNDLSTYGTHPKDFDPEQVKPVLVNLAVVIRWYLKFKGIEIPDLSASDIAVKAEAKDADLEKVVREGTFPVEKIGKSIKAVSRNKFKKAILPVLVIVVLLIVVLIILSPLKQKIAFGTKYMEKSVAVLPFVNLSGDPDQEYFSDGMMDEILDRLFKIGDLKVISRTSAMRYKDTKLSLKEIARELGVANILEGSVRKAGNMVRITVQLINAETDTHLWSETYDSDLSELSRIFMVQSEVAQSVAKALKAVISPEEKGFIEKVPTTDAGAYDDLLRGKFYLYKFTGNDCETAIKYFKSALAKDPNYAPAHANIALSWGVMVQMGFKSPEEGGPFIQESLMKALELDSNSAEVQYTLALNNVWSMWDWKAGEEAFKKTLSINPNHAEAHAYYAHYLVCMGRPQEEVIKEIETALKLDPLNPVIISLCGVAQMILKKYPESIKLFNDALQISPDYMFALSNLGEAYYLTGRIEEALEKYKAYYTVMNLHDVVKAIEKGVKEGSNEKAFVYMAEALERQFNTSYWVPAEISWRFVQAGDKNKALYWLEIGYEKHDPNMPYLSWPLWDPIRDEPRFQEIARKMNLPYKQIY